MVFGGIVSAIGSIASGVIGASAADKAADSQRFHSNQAIAAQRQQYGQAAELLEPYREVGTDALNAQRAFLGLGDPNAYQQQIDLVTQSPAYTYALQQGEEALLQNASATGGLRGGDTARALSQFRPQLLAQMLDQQYNRLGGLASSGQQAVMQQAMQAQNLGSQIAGQQNIQGNAAAQGALGRGLAFQQGISGASQGIGQSLSAFGGGFGGAGGGIAQATGGIPRGIGGFLPTGNSF